MAQAERAPDAVAVVCGDAHVSYGELVARAGRFAWYLRQAGAGPETVVGLCLERGVELVTAVVGVWLVGAAYLPLDPAYPPARLEAMLAGGRAGLLVGTGEVLDELPAGRVRVIEIDARGVAEQIAGMPPLPGVPLRVGQAAYVIFTSGSTGQPKGVAASHGGLANLAAAQMDRFAVAGGIGCWRSPPRDSTPRCGSWQWRWPRGRCWWLRRRGRCWRGVSLRGWWPGRGLVI